MLLLIQFTDCTESIQIFSLDSHKYIGEYCKGNAPSIIEEMGSILFEVAVNSNNPIFEFKITAKETCTVFSSIYAYIQTKLVFF